MTQHKNNTSLSHGDSLKSASPDITINNATTSVSAVWHSLTGGKFILRVTTPGQGWAHVLDDQGNIIGDANQMYSDGGWAVHTKPFGGYVPSSQIIFV
jgi:hypothetical protein